MMKLTRLAIYVLLANLLFINYVHAAAVSATPTVYQMTMKKVELCTSSACTTTTVLAEKDGTFNIASAAAGADVGSWISGFALEVGTTYTHIKATMDSSFTIRGYVTDDNSNFISEDYCATIATPTDTASSHTTHAITAGSNATTTAEMTWVVPDMTGGSYGDLTSSFATKGITKVNGASTFYWTGALTSSFTPTASSAPKITISFDVTGQLQAGGNGANPGLCKIWVMPPACTVTLTE
ncbi:MAG: hypothetical protein QGG44_02155 [Alphaproteobacteria bacterium]|nr:hypothetical protein [Alphaproteobacteria bacterium]